MVVILPDLPRSTWWHRLPRIRRLRVRFLRPRIERMHIHILILGVVVPWWRWNIYTNRGHWSWGVGWWIWTCERLFDIEVETRSPNPEHWPLPSWSSCEGPRHVNRPYDTTPDRGRL